MPSFSSVQAPSKQQAGSGSTGAVKVLGSNPTQHNFVIVTILWGDATLTSAGTVTVQDGNGNVYTQVSNSPADGDPIGAGLIYTFILADAPANAEKTITAAWSVAPSFAATLWVSEWGVSGGTASVEDSQKGTGGPTTNITTPSVSAAGAGNLQYSVAISDHQVSSVASPWTQDQAGAGVNQFAEGIGHILSGASGSTAVAMVQNTSSAWASMAISVKITAPAGAPFVPVVFDNPVLPKRVQPVDHRQNLLQSTLQPTTSLPFRQSDFPNPLQPKASLELRTHTSWFVIDDNVPFRQSNWQLPRIAPFPIENRTFLNPAEVQLIGKDQFFGAPGERTIPDQPNPQVARRVDLTHVVNLLESTLGLVIAAPFKQGDWPNPRGYTFPSDLRTFINAAEVQLIGKDQFFGAPGERTPPDQPNPTLGKRIDLTHVLNLLNSTLGIVFPYPFSLQDQPNPRGYIYPNELRTFLNAMESQLIGKDQMFGAPGQVPQYDFPNPQPVRRSYDVGGGVANLLETTLSAIQPPFFQIDWPNPRGPQRLTDMHAALTNLLTNTLGIVVQAPFVQLDWPNPQVANRAIELRTFVDQLKINLLGKDQFFGAPGQPPANYDQPNPRGYTYPVVCRVFVGPLNNALLASIGPVPFAQNEWPNPQIARQPIVLRTFLDPTKIHLIGKDQFFGAPGQVPANLHWPVPQGYRYPVDLRWWMNNLLQGTLTPPVLFRMAYIDGDAYITTDITMDSVSFSDIDGDTSLESQ